MTNPFAEKLLKLSNERFSIDSTNMPMSEWIEKNTTLRKKPFSFKGYEFQRQIVDDMHPNMDVIKPSQVGLTEVQIRKALAFLKRNSGTSLIFTLPNEDMYKRTSNSRIKPIVNSDEVFYTAEDKEKKVTRSMDLMQFGDSFLYVLPAIESAATSNPADAVFTDEIDLSDQKWVALFASRMQNSKFKIWQRFSTPTFPNYGIDANWRTSDQHEYLCKCESCGHWNNPEFDHKFIHLPGLPDKPLVDVTEEEYRYELDFDEGYVKCEKCSSRLPLGDPSKRLWVSNHPNRHDSRGYRVSPFSTDRLDLRYIFNSMWRYQKNEFVRGFYNTTLGIPYSDGTMQIPEEDIRAAFRSPTHQKTSETDCIWVGIDMGKTCHVTLGRGPNKDNLEVIAMYQVHSKDIVNHVALLCKEHNLVGGCVDRHPYTPTAEEIFSVSGGRVVPVEYRGHANMNLVHDVYDNFSHAQVNSTWFLDNLASKMRKRSLPISGYGSFKEVIVSHFRDMVRDESPGNPAVWKKLTGQDHFLHSTAFMVFAPELVDIVRLYNKEDPRSLVLTLTANVSNNTSNLVGFSNKRYTSPAIGSN